MISRPCRGPMPQRRRWQWRPALPGCRYTPATGFLFSQFLSPLFNHREDAYGGSVAGRFRIIGETIDAVRRSVGPSFPVGIRINATDRLRGGLTEDDALEVVRLLDRTSTDLIDVSGGTYFPGAPSSSDDRPAPGPYFIGFASAARSITSTPIMLTGGFRTRQQAAEAVADGATDAVGLARAMALDPALARKWLSASGGDPEFPSFPPPPPGAITAWYSMRLTALGLDEEESFDMSPEAALAAYDARDAERCPGWMARFGAS